jgi:hypothetical protein
MVLGDKAVRPWGNLISTVIAREGLPRLTLLGMSFGV